MSLIQNKISIVESFSYHQQYVNNSLLRLLTSLGLTQDNPFASFIKPGMKVFIKPNFVASKWRESCPHKDNIFSVITHPSVIEAVCDKIALALDGKGEITIGDNPSIDANFEELMELTGLKRLENKYKVKCRVIDLRPLICDNLDNYGKKEKMKTCQGDPLGETTVNLGQKSQFYGIDSSLFRGVFDERDETIASHSGENQIYTFSNSIFNSDVYISIPKLKTHHKSGVTLNLKGLVGTISRKNQLIHWRIGYPEIGGDEYPDKESFEKEQNSKIKSRGSWNGNDTIWRMVVDIYNAFSSKKRSHFSIIDGIIGGEGCGPFCPNAKYSNVLIGGFDLINTDIVAARLMGLNPEKIFHLNYFIDNKPIIFSDLSVKYENKTISNFFNEHDKYLDFKVLDKWNVIKINSKAMEFK